MCPYSVPIFARWLLAAAIVVLPSSTFAQVRSGVQSGVRSGFDHYNSAEPRPRGPAPYYSSCWRTTVVRGQRIVWNCQPYPPPSPY
jgi:hypothetical protein